MNEFGISTLVGGFIARDGLENALARLAAAGLNGIEMPAPKPEQNPAELTGRARDAGLSIVNVGIFENLTDGGLLNRGKNTAWVREVLKPSVRLAKVSGAGKFQWCCVDRPAPDETMDEFRTRLLDRLTIAAEMANDEGVIFVFEPLAPDSAVIATSTAEGVSLVKQVNLPGIRMTFDTYHSASAGEDPAASLHLALPWTEHVHLSDIRRKNNVSERPMPGKGTIDWKRFLSALSDTNYRGFVGVEGVFETDKPYEELAECVNYIRRLMRS